MTPTSHIFFPLSSDPGIQDAFWTQLLASLMITSSSLHLSEFITLPSPVSHPVLQSPRDQCLQPPGWFLTPVEKPASCPCLRTHSRMTPYHLSILSLLLALYLHSRGLSLQAVADLLFPLFFSLGFGPLLGFSFRPGMTTSDCQGFTFSAGVC